jgi:hypothetical protein
MGDQIVTTSYWLHVKLGKNVHQCGFLVLKHISQRLLRIGVHFIKYDIQGVFLKCAEILPTRLWDNVEDQKQLKKIVAQKINVIFIFNRIF